MAGKKKKSGSETKSEAAASFLPKSIAGVKLPKGVRNKLTDLAKHPVVADLLAAGLVALAAKLRNEPAVQKGAKDVADKAGAAAQTVAKTAADIATAVAKPVVKRTRKPAAPKPAAPKPAAAEAATPAPRRRAAAKPASEASGIKPPARRATKPAAKSSDNAKPRATRRATPKAPAKPKTPKTDA